MFQHELGFGSGGRSLGGRLRRSWRARGLFGTISQTAVYLQHRVRETSWGTDTQGSIEGRALGHVPSYFGYQPVPYGWCEWALKGICLDPTRDTFLDYGCGKGRAVIAAARFPFRKVIGVELSADLAGVARHNVRMAGSRLVCQNVQIVQVDALSYSLPDDVTVAFLFNPFEPSVVMTLAECWQESLARARRPFSVIYVFPTGREDCLQSVSWLTPRTRYPHTAADGQQMSIYSAELPE